MSTDGLIFDLLEAGADLERMRKEWRELSETKGWPTTREGFRRYCQRALDSKTFPKVETKNESAPQSNRIPPTPRDFTEWWQRHPDAAFEAKTGKFYGPVPRIAWKAACYYDQWWAERGMDGRDLGKKEEG